MADFLGYWTFAPWQWWLLGGALVVLEALAPGFVLIWVGLAALATGGLLWLFPAMSVPAQLVAFALISAGTVLGWFTMRRGKDNGEIPNGLNQRTASLIGAQFELSEPIHNGRGRIRVGDSVWSVSGPDLPVASRVRVVGADGVVLRVELVPG